MFAITKENTEAPIKILADEKKNFERFLAERDFSSQILIKPIVLKLPLIEIQIVKVLFLGLFFQAKEIYRLSH